MSLARLGSDSDVYVYEAVVRRIHVCQWCTFKQSRERIIYSVRAMRRHLKRHVAAGDKVPSDAFRAVAGKGWA